MGILSKREVLALVLENLLMSWKIVGFNFFEFWPALYDYYELIWPKEWFRIFRILLWLDQILEQIG